MKRQRIGNAQDAVNLAKELVGDKHKEHFIIIWLNARNQGRAELVSMGTINASLVHPRETFRTAIVRRASSIICLHNHPSKELEPSDADIRLKGRLMDAGTLVGIELSDFIIFDEGGKYNSVI